MLPTIRKGTVCASLRKHYWSQHEKWASDNQQRSPLRLPDTIIKAILESTINVALSGFQAHFLKPKSSLCKTDTFLEGGFVHFSFCAFTPSCISSNFKQAALGSSRAEVLNEFSNIDHIIGIRRLNNWNYFH